MNDTKLSERPSADVERLAEAAREALTDSMVERLTTTSANAMEVVDRLIATSDMTERHDQAMLLRDLCDTMQYGSLCAMGGMTAYPVASALKYFPADFGLTHTEAAQ